MRRQLADIDYTLVKRERMELSPKSPTKSSPEPVANPHGPIKTSAPAATQNDHSMPASVLKVQRTQLERILKAKVAEAKNLQVALTNLHTKIEVLKTKLLLV